MFNKKIINSVNNHSSSYGEEVWGNIETKLNEKRKRTYFIVFFMSIALILTTYALLNSDFSAKNKTEIPEDNFPTP
jgi:hypothetical protein